MSQQTGSPRGSGSEAGGEAISSLRPRSRVKKAPDHSIVTEIATGTDRSQSNGQAASKPPAPAEQVPQPAPTPEPAAAPVAAEPQPEPAAPPVASEPNPEPAEKPYKASIYITREDRARANSAILHTQAVTGVSNWSNFVVNAIVKECQRLEAAYNDGEPFPVAGDVKRGRPLSS